MAQYEYSAPPALLNGLSASQFLGEYWQKKPLLVRQALPNFEPPLDPDELAGLSCEEHIESRIISGSGRNNDWRLLHGPFNESIFSQLGEHDWTLLVQAVDHYLPAIAALKNPFRFIPDWRLDDVMVSFAAPGGSVGPHLDQYDVFLIQGEGRRQWQVGERIHADTPLLPHPELQLLREFNAVETHVLVAGDMLYLPPGYPHWGIALEPCMTYSIGFRAPSHEEIISHYCDHLLAGLKGANRYTDPQLPADSNPGLIDQAVLNRLHDIVASLLDEKKLAQWFGCYMTQPKYDNLASSSEDDWNALEPDSILALDSASRLAFTEQQDETVLYADGQSYSGSGKAWRRFVRDLCASQKVDPKSRATSQILQNDAIEATLRELLHRGVLTTDIW